MKKNIWSAFSLIGFMLLFFVCAVKIIVKCIKEKNFSLWLGFFGLNFFWWVGIVMIPTGIAVAFTEKVSVFNDIAGKVYIILILSYVYMAGLLITRKLYDWKVDRLEINISEK